MTCEALTLDIINLSTQIVSAKKANI